MECGTATKGVAIDGASFANTRRALGIEQTDFKGLVHCFKKRVGSELPFVEEPRSTIHPKFNHPQCQLYQDMRRAGIVPRPVEGYGSADDNYVVKWGSRYICAPNVAEVIVVTCDGGIIDTLLTTAELRERRYGRRKIFILGTCHPDVGGQDRMNKSLLQYLRKCESTEFIDIAVLVKYIGQRHARH